MRPGSIVIYIEDPLLFGKLLVLEVIADGRRLCEAIHADRHGDFARELFDVHELVLFDRWAAATVTA